MTAVVAVLLVGLSITLTVVPAVRAQVMPGARARVLEPLAASLGYEVIRGGVITVGPNQRYAQTVTCPAGKKVVGGGVDSGSDFSRMISSYPASGWTGWEVKGFNDHKTATASVVGYAICINAS